MSNFQTAISFFDCHRSHRVNRAVRDIDQESQHDDDLHACCKSISDVRLQLAEDSSTLHDSTDESYEKKGNQSIVITYNLLSRIQL